MHKISKIKYQKVLELKKETESMNLKQSYITNAKFLTDAVGNKEGNKVGNAFGTTSVDQIKLWNKSDGHEPKPDEKRENDQVYDQQSDQLWSFYTYTIRG